MGMVAAERIFNILGTQSQIMDQGTHSDKNINGSIKFEDLRFSYIKGEEVLHGISLTIQPGETIAIVGATGAGKSTIINLLSRFYEFVNKRLYIYIYIIVVL